MKDKNINTNNSTLTVTHKFNSSVQRLWDVWTKPEHLAHWWGPSGFTITTHKLDFEEGGEWIMTLHGPDGRNFPNKSIYLQIISLRKIVFEHFNPHFITTVIFEQEGAETIIYWSLLFDSPEMHDTIVKAHNADEGQKQNIERLEKYLLYENK